MLRLHPFLCLHQRQPSRQALHSAHNPVSLVLPPRIQHHLVPVLDEPHKARPHREKRATKPRILAHRRDLLDARGVWAKRAVVYLGGRACCVVHVLQRRRLTEDFGDDPAKGERTTKNTQIESSVWAKQLLVGHNTYAS